MTQTSQTAQVQERRILTADLAVFLAAVRARGQASLPVTYQVLLPDLARVLRDCVRGRAQGPFPYPEMLPDVLQVQSARDWECQSSQCRAE